jgi:5-methyltetrahydrofolate--homocysteine methyltransferase
MPARNTPPFPTVDILVFDGACGTSIQNMALPLEAWAGCEGCNELLNVTRPDAILAMHRAFVEAGADVLETNTFGANRVVLAEYGLQDRVAEINAAAVAAARSAAAERPGVRVCGSMGPGTKLALLDQISIEALAASYAEQAEALVAAGVDLLMLETCQDLLQIKTALVACFDVLERLGKPVPIMVSVTVETTGTLLTGTDIAAVIATLEPYPLFSLGLNCATGPREMAEHVATLSRHWPGRISVLPNAGLPQLVDGKTVYPLGPEEFAAAVRHYVTDLGVSVVGGCCGTTPAHIRALRHALQDARPAERSVDCRPRVASAYQALDLQPDIPPFLIGERLNANGSKAFRECLLAEDAAGALRLATRQEAEGAMALDVCTAYAGRDERADLVALVRALRTTVKVPLMVDSTTPDCLDATLRLYPGRCLINSINLEDGGKTLDRVCPMVRRYGAAVVALTIGETGMAMTADAKVAVAREIYDRAVGVHGLRPSDLIFDPLTFTIGSGDATLRTSALETLEAIRRIKSELPGVMTSLGLSNISFGLSPAARKLLNSVFLHEAVEAGLDAAIVDVAKIVPLHAIPALERQLCLDLIRNATREDGVDPLTAFIQHFAVAKPAPAGGEVAETDKPLERRVSEAIIGGSKEGMEDMLDGLLRRYTANAVINTILVPAMREVGALFASGEMLLPFVLQSAEAMKHAVGHLERFMDKAQQKASLRVLLATVQGDVHDIGKNLVDIILSNNGYTVHNLGIKVPAETIIAKARELNVDVIGLSGLLVKSALVMRDNMPIFRDAGLTQPILLGGAALTPSFVANDCVPGYPSPVVYCADAFAGLRAIRAHEAGTLVSTHVEVRSAAAPKPSPREVELDRGNRVPTPPFLGAKHVTGIPVDAILPFMNEPALFRGRWGYRRGKLSAAEYDELTETRVRPIYADLVRRSREEGLVNASVAYGYFRAYAEGDNVMVEDGNTLHAFPFPRQSLPPHRCIADYYKTREEGGDIAAFFVVTVGAAIDKAIHELFDANRYHDYLMLHGYSVELTDALAEYWHEVMRRELDINAQRPASVSGYATQEYQGSRYGFGYPACPDLDAHRAVFALLKPEAIGVTLTENMQMVPEQTTSAIIAHHPQAKYFAV